jgi:hypothetical protein
VIVPLTSTNANARGVYHNKKEITFLGDAPIIKRRGCHCYRQLCKLEAWVFTRRSQPFRKGEEEKFPTMPPKRGMTSKGTISKAFVKNSSHVKACGFGTPNIKVEQLASYASVIEDQEPTHVVLYYRIIFEDHIDMLAGTRTTFEHRIFPV